MNFHRKTWALLFSTTITLTATHAQAQQDTFEQLRVAPSALTGLFDQSPSQVRDLSEAVDAAITERIEQGGTDVAHVLMTFDEPLTADRRLELEQNGIQIIDRFDETIWVARVTTRGADFAETAAPVGEATLFPSEAKLSDQISLDAPFDWQRREGSDALGYSVLFHKGISAEEAVNSLVKVTGTRVDGVDEASFPYVRSITIPLTPDALAAAAALDIVQRIEPEAPPNEDFNLNNTQPVSNVDDVQVAPYNLSGAGVTVGVWEAGDIVRPTHQDLTPRVTVQPGQTTSQDGHALHVAGTIGASGVNAPNAEGMAPAVTILSWDANSDTAEMANAATAANPIVASNHSYGARIGWTPAGTGMELQGQNLFGAYNNRSIGFDTVVAGDGVGVAGTELVILKAAGNDRGDGPNNPAQPDDCRQGGLGIDADCIGPVGSAKNVITVGAMNGGTLIAGFSGFGPTDAGRIKPDIMANGTNVTSLGSATAAGNDDIAQTDTGTWPAQGTSMATPAVTGIVALMTEQLQQLGLGPLPSAAAYKAILIQTARDVNGTGQATLGPDFATGWGIADAQAAMDLLRRAGGPGFAEGTLTATGAGGAWDFPFVVPAGETEMHVTLAWSDLPGAALVNDLDLRLLPPGGGAGFQPWTLNPANPGAAAVRNGGDDTVNTVEQVSVLNPAAGTWVARVTAKPGSLALGGQRFAIAGPITPDTGPIASPKADIMMVMDKSGSMILPAATPAMTKMQAMQNAATAFVDYIELIGGHNLGIVAFNSSVVGTVPNFGLQPLDGTTAGDARTAIGNLSPGGNTGIIAGVTEATNQLVGPNATNPDDVVFLFSDGRHNRPIGSDVSVIDGLMAADTRFFSIGFGTDVDSTVMPGVAANHDGVHLEEQSLQAGQLAKLFMVVGGLATDETIILDPDFPVASGAGDSQTILATQSEHSLTFAAFWNEQNSEKVALQLFGPNRRCRIPMQKHDGFDMRLGPTYALARIELPYRCTAGQVDAILHEGDWTLRFQNRGATSDTVKVMVLADSGVTLRTDSKVGTGKALLMARLIEGDELLRKGVRIFANMRPNRPSSGDSEKQDGVTGNDRPNVTVTVPGRGLGSVVGPDTPVIIAPPARGGIVAGETREKENMITFDASQRLNPALLEALQQRAEIMGLRPEVLEQLRGRFVMPMEPTGIELRDDGTNGDEGINDGIFSAIVSLPNPGLYQIRTVATQARPEGIMTREALSSVLTK